MKTTKVKGVTMMELYGPINSEAFIDSQYGHITEMDWLLREQEHINSQPGRIAFIEKGCLWVNQIAG
ncbi:MAG: hypothetical protein WC346_16760 [Methanogenium sp.]|jgi:hypothetical protein